MRSCASRRCGCASWNGRSPPRCNDRHGGRHLLAHPGKAGVTRRRSSEPMSRRLRRLVVGRHDGHHLRRTQRAGEHPAAGSAWCGRDPSGPAALLAGYVPRTRLPAETLADTFIHPHGYIRNVLLTGPVALTGTAMVHGREAFVLRADHPRSTYVLTDRTRPLDRGRVDRQTGFIVLPGRAHRRRRDPPCGGHEPGAGSSAARRAVRGAPARGRPPHLLNAAGAAFRDRRHDRGPKEPLDMTRSHY